MKLTILAIGKLHGPHAELCAEYTKRMTGGAVVRELTAPNQKAEGHALVAAIPPKSFVVLMDEHGRDLSSRELADKMRQWEEQAGGSIVFIIGGADGLTDEVREKGQFTLGLGRKTWPHKLARVMLFEQLYRAQQINAGHPYHRD